MAAVLAATTSTLKEALASLTGPSHHLAGPDLQTVFEQFNTESLRDVERRRNHIAASGSFNLFIGFLILLDAITAGVEVEHARGDSLEDRMFYVASGAVFFVFFVGEMLVRMNQLGWEYFVDPWNIFDYLLVITNLSDLVILAKSGNGAGLKLATTLRALRLLRVVRVIRGRGLLHKLWIVFRVLLDSFRAVLWIAALFLMVTFSTAVVITALVENNEGVKNRWRHCELYVGTPWRSLWTLIQAITLDRWAVDIARPLNEVSPMAVCVLVFTIIACTFGIANTVIAVMVETVHSIMQKTATNRNVVLEETLLNVAQALGDDFQLAELDENGDLGFEEFRELLRVPKIALQLRLLGILSEEAELLYETIDVDKCGAVSPEEIIIGLAKLQGPAKGQDLVALICCCQLQCQRVVGFLERVRQLNAKADMIQARLDDVGKGFSKELLGRTEASQRCKEVWKRAADRELFLGALDREREVTFPEVKQRRNTYGIMY